ncbi:MAG: helix-turn-helix transcriptional regulator [Lachnospiraceae bacterium]|nr:helix-turn-helix transcriptional regulator [Lachnospiraceae bacterium]
MTRYNRLRDLREDADLTQAEIGARLHISQRSYAHFEAGTRGIPVEILIDLADLYQVNLDYLVGRTNHREMLPRTNSTIT